MKHPPITEAKDQLVRVNQILSEPLLLIGGLAVQQYVFARSTYDLDLVCAYEQARVIAEELFPLSDWRVEDINQDELRPALIARHKIDHTKPVVKFGPKIAERGPYSELDWEILATDATPFMYRGMTLDNILVPSAERLAFSKLLAFLGRDLNKAEKLKQDLQDLHDLANHGSFQIETFSVLARQAELHDRMPADFHGRLHLLGLSFRENPLAHITQLFGGETPQTAAPDVVSYSIWLAGKVPAEVLLDRDPSTVPQDVVKRKEWRLLFARACVRKRRASQCKAMLQEWVETILKGDTAQELSSAEAEGVRHYVWSLSEAGDHAMANNILSQAEPRVSDSLERGRLLDRKARSLQFQPDSIPLNNCLETFDAAITLKAAAEDLVGLAMSLEGSAVACIEHLDIHEATRRYRQLRDFAEERRYAGFEFSLAMALVGEAWCELMLGGEHAKAIAKRHLGRAMTELGASEGAIAKPARAVHTLLKALEGKGGGHARLVESVLDDQWASIVVAQAHRVAGHSEQEAMAIVERCEGPRELTLGCSRRLIRLFAEPLPPSLELSFLHYLRGGPFPLDSWSRTLKTAFDATRLMEGLGDLYVGLIAALGQLEGDPRALLSNNFAVLRQWQLPDLESSDTQPERTALLTDLAAEVTAFSQLVQASKADRNDVVHGRLGRPEGVAESNYLRAVEAALDNAKLLRGMKWEGAGSTLRVGEALVEMAPYLWRDDETGKLQMLSHRGPPLQQA